MWSKMFFIEKNVGKKLFSSTYPLFRNILDQKNFSGQKLFLVKKHIVQKVFGQKWFWAKKNVGSKQY